MTAILGISAFYHDSAAALVVDGHIVAAAQEERFSRKKHDDAFPKHAVQYCLNQASISPEDLDYVGFYEKPIRKFERLLETYLAYAPVGYRSFRKAMPIWIKHKLHIPRELRDGLEHRYSGRYVFTDHHQSHAASAFFPSPYDEAAILTIDGVGEWSTACIGVGRGNQVNLVSEIRFPHSLGLLYSAFTYYTGFRVNSGEYKLMGLAPYGQPIYKDAMLRHLIDLKSDGSFRLDMSYFNYCQGLTMTSKKFDKLFGGPPRKCETEITQREKDLAASIQMVTEEVMLRMALHTHNLTGMKHLVLAGGVALNAVGNGRLLREGPFEEVWIQPAAGDAGGALGNALFIWHHLLEQPRRTHDSPSQYGSLLGPSFSDEEIEQVLEKQGANFVRYDTREQLCERVADLVASEKVIGWFEGRMEYGPRALGSRSILGDARSPTMQSVMNRKIKFRESFRPFAPVVLREHAEEYFDVRKGFDSPFMTMVVPVREPYRDKLPAVTHVDGSARIQTVDQKNHPNFHQLLIRFHEMTGCAVMINTSFNIRGEPMVCTPEDAYRCFMATEMDGLVLGNFLLIKADQPNASRDELREQHLSRFAAD